MPGVQLINSGAIVHNGVKKSKKKGGDLGEYLPLETAILEIKKSILTRTKIGDLIYFNHTGSFPDIAQCTLRYTLYKTDFI